MKKPYLFIAITFLFIGFAAGMFAFQYRQEGKSSAQQKENAQKNEQYKVLQGETKNDPPEQSKEVIEVNNVTSRSKVTTEEEKRQELLTQIYKLNDKGDGVKEIQKLLNKFGYNLTVDGVYGMETYYAISDFQSKAKLQCDGAAGPATIAKLQQPPTEELMYRKSVQTAGKGIGNTAEEKFINSMNAVSKTDFYIYVDTAKFRVNIFKGHLGNWTLLRSAPCSIGKPATPTIKGKFAIGNKGLYFKADGGVICKYFSQIHGGYLFHSVLYDSKGKKIVDGRLGMKISHGCIRLATEDAKYIYESIPAGTAIWIQ